MADDSRDRIVALEAKVQELETLVNLALRLLAVERPLSALLSRYGATEAEDRAVHALLDDLSRRVEAGGIAKPAFAGFMMDLARCFPAIRNDREFVALLLDTLKVERPSYQKLHEYNTVERWPQWH